MLRITVFLALLVSVRPGFAQYSVAEVKDEVRRLDTRHFDGYKRTVDNRDFFASTHDSIKHPAYTEMRKARDNYVAIRSEISQHLAAEKPSNATKRLPDLKAAGEALDDRVRAYMSSSSSMVQKIQIGLGVVAFVICGLVYLIFRRRNKR